MDLDVQVQIEQAVMVDYNPRTTSRESRVFWEGKQGSTTDRTASPVDQGQWELSDVTETAGTV